MLRAFRNSLLRLGKDEAAASIVTFSIAAIPLGIGAGAAVDYGRALSLQTKMRTALDLAVLSAVHKPAAQRSALATAAYVTQVQDSIADAPVFANQADGSLLGTATATMPTILLKLARINTVAINVTARASKPVIDESCILALGNGMSVTSDALKLNGASNTNLTGCTMRSNTSMVCNGHTGNSDASIAAGNSSKCNAPESNAGTVPDIHAALAANIEKQCGLTSYNINWSPGSPPASPRMITRVKNGVTYRHVCGNVTVSGSGVLSGDSANDSILVIENGSLTIARNADITLERTTLVFTGALASASHAIEFPQGNGHSASLTVSPSQDASNPWQGVAIYQDPSMTTNVNMSWGPGATLKADGLLYFPNASLTMSGVAQSHNAECSKLVINELTSNGGVDFKQTDSGCDNIGLKQYKAPPRLLF